jgi:hypothetical protein
MQGSEGATAMPTTPPREFSDADMKVFEREAKIGLLATVSPDGLPHISLITSLQARDPRHLMFGQFTEGLSKKHVRKNPRTGFLVMSPQKEVWRGKARWTHMEKSGEDYELYNRKPMFRYNAYLGIHTVHYLDLVDFSGRGRLEVGGLVAGILVTAFSHLLSRRRGGERILKHWAENHVSKPGTLKFLAFVSDDGYPTIVPGIPCRAAGSRRLVFAPTVHRRDLGGLSKGEPLALFALSLEMESVLVRGRFTGYTRKRGPRTGSIDIDWVYNSMPPKQGPIYPVEPLGPVKVFDKPARGNLAAPSRS